MVLHHSHTPPPAPWAKTSPCRRRRRPCSPWAALPDGARRHSWRSWGRRPPRWSRHQPGAEGSGWFTHLRSVGSSPPSIVIICHNEIIPISNMFAVLSHPQIMFSRIWLIKLDMNISRPISMMASSTRLLGMEQDTSPQLWVKFQFFFRILVGIDHHFSVWTWLSSCKPHLLRQHSCGRLQWYYTTVPIPFRSTR